MLSHISVLILGIIEEKPVNPYEIKKLLDRIQIRKWMPIAVSSVYGTVRELSRKEYCVGMPEKDGNMPEKTVYTITKAGRTALHQSLREYLGSTDLDRKKFQVSALLLCHIERAEVIGILKNKCVILEEMADRIESMAKKMRGRVPYTGHSMVTHELAYIRAEKESTNLLLEGIKQDENWDYFVSKDLIYKKDGELSDG